MVVRHTGGIVYLRGPQPKAYERLQASRDMWYDACVQMLQENKRLTKELEQSHLRIPRLAKAVTELAGKLLARSHKL